MYGTTDMVYALHATGQLVCRSIDTSFKLHCTQLWCLKDPNKIYRVVCRIPKGRSGLKQSPGFKTSQQVILSHLLVASCLVGFSFEGWFNLETWEAMHTANPPYANYSWHAAGAAVETLRILASADIITPIAPPFVPPAPFKAVGGLLSGGPTVWDAFMSKWCRMVLILIKVDTDLCWWWRLVLLNFLPLVCCSSSW